MGSIILIHLLVLTWLPFGPYPELFIYSYLTEQGLIPYTQILDQHFPGLMLSPINFFTLGFDDIASMRIMHLGLILINHILIYLTANILFRSQRKALLSNLIYILYQPFFEGYILWIENLVTPLLLAAFYFAIKKGSKNNLLCSGLLLGLTLLFKQVVVPMIAAIIIYLYLTKKDWIRFTIATAATSSLILIMSVYYQNFPDLFYWTATFNLTTFAEMGRKYPTVGNLLKSLPIFGFALISIILSLFKKRSTKIDWLVLFFFGSLVFVYARFDYVHLQPALAFAALAAPLGILMLKNVYQIAIITLFTVLAIYLTIPVARFYEGRDNLYFGEHEQLLAAKVTDLTQEGDRIFAMATTPHLYYLTNTLPPGDIFVFHFPWFMIEAEDRILDGIKKDEPKVIARDMNATTSGMNLVSYMPKINKYVEENYQTIDMVGETEIMIRK